MLKFIHIPKTAGTCIEESSKETKITSSDNTTYTKIKWGLYDDEMKLWYPKQYDGIFWHTPLWYTSYYHTCIKGNIEAGNVVFFTVVRNPYTRAISEYHYLYKLGKIPHILANNRIYFNNKLSRLIRKYKTDDNHMLAQSEFVFDNNNYQMVKHVLKYESLQHDFDTLMSEYHLDIKLKSNINISPKIFTIDDLFPSTIKLINEVYHDDFVNFDYDIIYRPSHIMYVSRFLPQFLFPNNNSNNNKLNLYRKIRINK
jgi:hypothetical protein